MHFQESNEEYGQATEPVFQQVIQILEEQGITAKMISLMNKQNDHISKGTDLNEWVQWQHEDYVKNDSVSQIAIQEERKFLFDEKHNHMWYKNINLPTITISVQSEVFCGGKYNILLDCFGVQIQEDLMIQNTSSQQPITPSFLGLYKRFSLEGEGIQQTIQSQKQMITFQRIKCKETSYNNKGIRFFIVLTIYEISTSKPILIRLSPSLYIESRKKSFQETQTLLGFSHPFQPDAITKIYAKCSETMTQDNIDSFNEYYSSCNIRHKILHPLFLFLKFSKAIKLYYNKQMIDQSIENKVYRFVKPLVGNIVQVYFNRKDIPSYMKEVIFKVSMKEDYQQIYQQLQDLKFNRSMNLGPSNTQHQHPEQQNQHQQTNSGVQNFESSLEESNSQENQSDSGKKKHSQIQFNQTDQMLKKRPFSSLNNHNNCQIYVNANTEAIAGSKTIIESKKTAKLGQNINSLLYKDNNQSQKQEVLQKYKKTSETTNNTRNSFYSGDNSLEDDQEFEEGTRIKKTHSISNQRKETLSRIPEISQINNHKENSVNVAQTPQSSITENYSQTTIYPDLNHQNNQVVFTNPAYHPPAALSGMLLPIQNQMPQPMMIPMNNYMHVPPIIQPASQQVPLPTAIMPQPLQVVINPYQMQNMYYPYHNPGYGMPMQVIHPGQPVPSPYIQSNMMNYNSHPQQQIQLQNNYQYIQQPKI